MCGTMGMYDDVVSLPLNGRVRTIDRCIHHIIAALNAGGVRTEACCCGHGKRVGNILLEDGRTLLILPAELNDAPEWIHSTQARIEQLVTETIERVTVPPSLPTNLSSAAQFTAPSTTPRPRTGTP